MRGAGLILFGILLSHGYVTPQFVGVKDGKLEVNFGGYHAGVGLGGLLGGGRTAGGLFAEAGTPHGQAARAGLGGGVGGEGKAAGGLYAGATAGGDVGASAGLAGGVGGSHAAGGGYAAANAAGHHASSGLGGESTAAGSSGFAFSASKSAGGSVGVVKETVVQPVAVVETVQPVKVSKHKEVQKHIDIDAANEVQPQTAFRTNVNVNAEAAPPVYVKEVYVPQPPIIEKHIYRHRVKAPRIHHKTYVSGYINAGVPPPPAVVYKTVSAPVIHKRIDVESAANAAEVQADGGANVGLTKTVTVQRNPAFFADIFNIPISTLQAVSKFLGNAAGSTSVSVHKSASVYAG